MLKEMKNWWRSFPCNRWQIFYAIVIALLIIVIATIGIFYFLDKSEEKNREKYSVYITTHLNEFKGKHKIARLGETIILSDEINLMFTTSNSGELRLRLMNNGREGENLLNNPNYKSIKRRFYGYYGYYGYIILEEISIKFHILLANEKMLIYYIEPLKLK